MSDYWAPSEEQRETLSALAELERQFESSSAFVRACLPFSAGKWSKIRKVFTTTNEPTYFDEIRNPDRFADSLDTVLENARMKLAELSRTQDGGIVELQQYVAIRKALTKASQARNEERIVSFTAPTGGGKTKLAHYLAREADAVIVEARDCWKRSKRSFLIDICRALRVRLKKERMTEAEIEDALIAALANRQALLVIDEAEFFGRAALNGLKLLMNKTRLTVCLCATPSAFAKWQRYSPDEADQVVRRFYDRFELSVISAKKHEKDLLATLPADFETTRHLSNGKNTIDGLALIAAEASEFGHWSFVARMSNRLKSKPAHDLTGLKDSIKFVRNQLRRSLKEPKK